MLINSCLPFSFYLCAFFFDNFTAIRYNSIVQNSPNTHCVFLKFAPLSKICSGPTGTDLKKKKKGDIY